MLQVLHLPRIVMHLSEHLRLVLRGRRSTSSFLIDFGRSPATSDANGLRLVLHGRLGAPHVRFAWQAQAWSALSAVCLQCKTRRRPFASPVARLPLHLYEDAQSAAPATRNEAAPIRFTRRQTSADLYEGAQSAAPATRNEAAPIRITRRQTSADLLLEVLRLPRKTSLRCFKDDVVLMVCCVDGVVLMVCCWWRCVDGVLLMALCGWWCCWWCVVDSVVWMVMCWWCRVWWCCVWWCSVDDVV